MTLLSKLFTRHQGSKPNDNRLSIAEAYIRDQTCLYRHYNIKAVQDSLRDNRAGRPNVYLTDGEAVAIVQKIRNEKGMGPIADYNMPGYVDPDEFIDLSKM